MVCFLTRGKLSSHPKNNQLFITPSLYMGSIYGGWAVSMITMYDPNEFVVLFLHVIYWLYWLSVAWNFLLIWTLELVIKKYSMGVSENGGTPKSSILIGISIIFTIHFGGNTPIFGNTPMGLNWGVFLTRIPWSTKVNKGELSEPSSHALPILSVF